MDYSRLTTRFYSYAAYAGNATLPDVTFYGGIPYIKAPVGNLRFAPPQKLAETPNVFLNNDDVVDARNWGPLCIQQPAVMGIGSEGLQSNSEPFDSADICQIVSL